MRVDFRPLPFGKTVGDNVGDNRSTFFIGTVGDNVGDNRSTLFIETSFTEVL